MSPSTSNKSLGGDPTTYEQIQQALFKVANSAGSSSSGNRIDSGIASGAHNLADSMESTVPSTSKGETNVSNAYVDATTSVTDTSKTNLDSQSGVVTISNLPFITASQQPKSRFSVEPDTILLSKSGIPEDSAIATNSEGENLIKPKPVQDETRATGVVAEASTSPSNSLSPSPDAMGANNDSSSTKAPERNSNNTSTKSKGTARRRGKWTMEEEEYVARVIQDFNSGFLNAPAGYTLRSYLSDKLQCDPMRITKKFTGESCIGKRVFHPAVRSAMNASAIDKAQSELDALERRWRRRLEMQQRESAKKAAASAAAASAASRGAVTVQGVPVSMLGTSSQDPPDSHLQQSAVTQAATWLDRANVILMGNISSDNHADTSFRGDGSVESSQRQYNKDESTSTQSSAEDSLENQMKEVQRLIYEGPIIQQTTAGLPNLLLRNTSTLTTDLQTTQNTGTINTIISGPSTSQTIGTTHVQSSSAHVSPTLEPADKRMRTTSTIDNNTTGAEDAEALVGFLRSVRASAAAGQEL